MRRVGRRRFRRNDYTSEGIAEESMAETSTPHDLGSPLRRFSPSRRALLRTGLALPPAVLVGVLAGKAPRGREIGARPAAAQMPSCIVTPQVTEGPYFVDKMLFRSDIREDPSDGTVKEGVSLRLAFRISDITGGACAPLAGAVVDLWHCDALGVYSDVSDPGGRTIGKKFLRGAQYTDAAGAAEFLTIYPGWYQGRTVHLHFKVRTDLTSDTGYEFTSQLFFDDALTDQVFTRPPYSAKGPRDTRNSNDGIFRGGGDTLSLAIVEEGDGYTATIDVGVDTSAPAQAGGPGGPGGPPPGAPDGPAPYPSPVGGGPPPIQGSPPPGATPLPAGAATPATPTPRPTIPTVPGPNAPTKGK
jgi:protocatechuate 3,4-dioxygenase beta subunit